MTAIVLPPSHVGANSPYFNDMGVHLSGAGDMIAYSSAYWLFAQQAADELFREDMYKKGDWKSALNSAFVWGKGEAMMALEKASVADYLVAKGASSIDSAIGVNWGHGFFAEVMRHYDGELSGGVYSPAAALFHSIAGSGTPMWANINNLGLHFEIGEFGKVHSAMMSADQGVSHLYIDKLAYATSNDSLVTGAFLGDITLKVEGNINKMGEAVSFSGSVKAWSDTFDANLSSHRSEFGEASTKVLNFIQTYSPAQPFEIKLIGELPISSEIHGE